MFLPIRLDGIVIGGFNFGSNAEPQFLRLLVDTQHGIQSDFCDPKFHRFVAWFMLKKRDFFLPLIGSFRTTYSLKLYRVYIRVASKQAHERISRSFYEFLKRIDSQFLDIIVSLNYIYYKNNLYFITVKELFIILLLFPNRIR